MPDRTIARVIDWGFFLLTVTILAFLWLLRIGQDEINHRMDAAVQERNAKIEMLQQALSRIELQLHDHEKESSQ